MLRTALALGGFLLAESVNLQAARPLVRRDAGQQAPPHEVEQVSDSMPVALAQAARAPEADDSAALPEEGGAEAAEDSHHQYEHSKASAQDIDNMMKTMDVDEDGKLSWLEVLAFFNREGSTEDISPEELQAGGYGPMTPEEKKELKDMFDLSDGDNDGKITRAELEKFLSAQETTAEKAAAAAVADGENPHDGIEGDDGGESLAALEGSAEQVIRQKIANQEMTASFREADANQDGHLSLEEVLSHIEHEEAVEHEQHGDGEAPMQDNTWKEDATTKFKAADKDADGLLSLSEFDALIQEDDKPDQDKQEVQEESEAEDSKQMKYQRRDEAPEEEGKSEEGLAELGGEGQEEDEAAGDLGAPGR